MTDANPRPRPRDVLARAHRALVEFDNDGFADLFAEDGVLEAPFTPARRVEGREAIRVEMRARGETARAGGLRLLGFTSLVVHETADPEVIVAEFREEVALGDRTRSLPFVQILRVRDGELVSFRDYMDSVGVAEAINAIPDLQAVLAGPPPAEVEHRSAEQ